HAGTAVSRAGTVRRRHGFRRGQVLRSRGVGAGGEPLARSLVLFELRRLPGAPGQHPGTPRRQAPLRAHAERIRARHPTRAGGLAGATLHRARDGEDSRRVAPLDGWAGRNHGGGMSGTMVAKTAGVTTARAGAAETSGVQKVLWMDGEIDFLRAHIRFLEHRGFQVDAAVSLAAATDLLRATPYALVLLDEQTLGKEGASTLHRIRAACPERTPLLLVTKADEERASSSERGRDVDGFVGKPVSPVQLLDTCRAALLARADRTDPATSSYVRTRQEIRTTLLAAPSPANWEKIHFQISKWDIVADVSSDRVLKDAHKHHRRALGQAFLGYIEDHYAGWVGKKGGNPDLQTQTVRRQLLPILQRRAPAALVLLSGLRFDQWLVIRRQVDAWFKVENAASWALLPTEAEFCRTALFSGELPREVSLDQPQLWTRLTGAASDDENGDEAERDVMRCYRELLRIQLRKLGHPVEDPRFVHVRSRTESLELAETLSGHVAAPLVVVVA